MAQTRPSSKPEVKEPAKAPVVEEAVPIKLVPEVNEDGFNVA